MWPCRRVSCFGVACPDVLVVFFPVPMGPVCYSPLRARGTVVHCLAGPVVGSLSRKLCMLPRMVCPVPPPPSRGTFIGRLMVAWGWGELFCASLPLAMRMCRPENFVCSQGQFGSPGSFLARVCLAMVWKGVLVLFFRAHGPCGCPRAVPVAWSHHARAG